MANNSIVKFLSRILKTKYINYDTVDSCYKRFLELASDHRHINFSLTISRSLQNELDFLTAVDQCPVLSDQYVINNAVRRYESLWLPLLAAARNPNSLTPPLDVHWIWHCHMLSPFDYRADCRELVGKVIDHIPKKSEELIAGRQRAAILWKQRYASESFDSLPDSSTTQYQRRSSYDLAAATQRQSKFFYNVSLPDRDERFLTVSLGRYKKFLHLKRRHEDALLIPCYDIDLVWHTHQLHPVAYEQDTVRILGRMLNHDDTIDDRVSGSVQQQAYSKTKQLWTDQYQEPYPLSGSMYRGLSSKGRLPAVDLPATNGVINRMEQVKVAADTNIGKTTLQLLPGPFRSCPIPADIEQLWGPIHIRRIPLSTDNTCEVATHSLCNTSGDVVYTVRVLHSIPLHMSAVHVLEGDRLVVVSHLVWNDQLPSMQQVKSCDCPFLDSTCGERAMIIKDNSGDYGIVVGKWIGFREGIQRYIGERRRGVQGKPGRFQVRYYPLRNTSEKEAQINRPPTISGERYFQFGHLSFDMKAGQIVIGSEDQPTVDVIQNSCLAMSISVLYGLCQPRLLGSRILPPKTGSGSRCAAGGSCGGYYGG